MAVRGFKDLVVWQKSMGLIEQIYRLTQGFPKQETYGLSSQVQRAAVSIAANIAEGNGRDSTREYIHHLAFSLGSLAEVETYLDVSLRLGYAKANAIRFSRDNATKSGGCSAVSRSRSAPRFAVTMTILALPTSPNPPTRTWPLRALWSL
jgi:four helix bundle protein